MSLFQRLIPQKLRGTEHYVRAQVFLVTCVALYAAASLYTAASLELTQQAQTMTGLVHDLAVVVGGSHHP